MSTACLITGSVPAGGEEPAILLGYANLTEEEIKKAVELLIRFWQ